MPEYLTHLEVVSGASLRHVLYACALTNLPTADFQSKTPYIEYKYLRNWDARILTSAPFTLVTNAGTTFVVKLEVFILPK